jgi:NTE family protein
MKGKSKTAPDHGVGLALSGGAARCIAQIGVLEVLEREGIKVSAIAGTSGGSLVGALYASGEMDVHEMQRMARNVKWRKMLKPAVPRMGLISSEKLYHFVKEMIHDRTFEGLPIPLAVVASDLRNGEKVVLTSGSVARAVQASCSLPVIFSPARINGRLLVDGGAASQLPVLTAREELGSEFVIGVDVNCNNLESVKLKNVFQIGVHFVSLFARRNAMLEKAYADVVIEVDSHGISLYDLDKAHLLIERGKIAAEKKIDEIKRYYKQRVNDAGDESGPF